jgi:hypothetical protein
MFFKGDSVFAETVHMSFATVTHLAEGLCLRALLTLKVENCLICLVGTRIPTVSVMELQLIFPPNINKK